MSETTTHALSYSQFERLTEAAVGLDSAEIDQALCGAAAYSPRGLVGVDPDRVEAARTSLQSMARREGQPQPLSPYLDHRSEDPRIRAAEQALLDSRTLGSRAFDAAQREYSAALNAAAQEGASTIGAARTLELLELLKG